MTCLPLDVKSDEEAEGENEGRQQHP